MKNLKRYILLFVFLIVAFTSFATNMFWVGGTGAWSDNKHWSLTSGGSSGNFIPTSSDDVFFDQNSFSADKQTIMVNSNATCRNLDMSGIDVHAIFSSGSTVSLSVFGSYKLSSLLWNGFSGQTIFAAPTFGNEIYTRGATLIGNFVFDGVGSWVIMDDIKTEEKVSFRILKGSLNTNGKTIICGSFIGSSNQQRSLELSSSEIFIQNSWDFSVSNNLNFNSGTSRIIFYDSLDASHYKSGGLIYNSVSEAAGLCSPAGTPCATFTISITGTNVICNGNSNGTATAVVLPAAATYSYDWSPGAPPGDGTANVSGLGAGTYTVRVTDLGTGLFCFCSISITEPGVLFDFELATTEPLCNGQCNGQSSVAATGGTGAYSYLWSGGLGTNDTVFNICAGTYNVDVTDVNGCFATTVIVVGEPIVLTAPGSETMVTCFGACDGTASVVVSGGTLPYTYNWSPGAPAGDGTANITGLCPGAYTCSVVDAHGCSTVFNTTITQPPILTLAVSHTNATCGGVCDGTGTATVSGGTSPYTYVWSTGATTTTVSTTNTVVGLCDGAYVVTVTDANGCTLNLPVVITEPLPLIATASGVNVTCFSLCNGTASVAVVGGNGGNVFDWTPGAPTGDGTANISALCPGTYTVSVVDINGCNDTGVVTITEPALLVANPVGTDVLCFGTCTGSATATPTGGTAPYTYNWSPGAPVGDLTPTISSLCVGIYSVLVTDANLCTSNQTVTITQPAVINTGLTFTNVSCNGACDGTATSAPSGGVGPYTFSWLPGGATTPTISSLCPGIYTVTVTDANGCTKVGSVTITQPNILTVSITATTLACNGDCNATATATIAGGTAPYTIDWLPGSPVGDGTTVISSLCAGVYTVNITDANGCLATATVTIVQPTVLSLIAASTDVTCFGLCNGSAAAIVGGGTPGYTYSWAPGGQTTASILGQCAGSYTVTITDLNGCTLSATAVINQPAQLLANPSIANNVTCAGLCDGSATSSPTGGTAPYLYNWTPGNPPGDGTPTITGLCAGNYNLTVTDLNLCSSTMPITISQPLVLSAPITGSTSSCNICNGSATVTPAGGTPGYTYLWMPSGQTTQTATGLCPNVTYTVTVTDANGCVQTNSVTILQTIIISITTSNTTLSCFGVCDAVATANAAGGTVPYSFIWTGPSGIISLTQTASGLCSGSYTVNVSDAAGCFNADTVTFIDPPQLIVTGSGTNVICGGACTGTATAVPVGGAGGYTYLWMPGGQTTATATALCAGAYTITLTDANGCTDTAHVVITEPSAIVDNETIVDANCTLADGSISVVPTGGNPGYTYNWGPGAPVGDGTPTITNLLPGAYTLAITDLTGCVSNFNYLLSNNAGPSLVMSHTDETCNNACDGTATAVASLGSGTYLYNWSPGAPVGDGTPAITALCGTATYTVQVTDAITGCIILDTARIINPALISPNATIVNESCGAACDGSITLVPTGGTGAYSYSWSGGLPPIANPVGLCASGSPYTVTVTDANGCSAVLIIPITSPPTLTVTLSSTNVLCNSACNGTATAAVAGGTGAGTYTYVWSHGAAFVLPNVVGLCPNSYTVNVTDNNGCTAADTVVITEPTALTSVTSQTNASCFGVCDGQVIVTANGGTIPYSYLWSPGAIANDTASGLCAGSYNAVVTDFNGCVTAPPVVVLTEPAPILPNATFVNPTCNASCNGTATAVPTGGSGVYTYSWNSLPVQNTQTATGLCAGTYIVTVDDGNCTATQSVTLVDPVVLNANPNFTSPTCADLCDGSVTAAPTGGTGVYSYSWMPGAAITQTVNGLCPNVYTVIVSDVNNCKDTATVTLLNALAIDVAIGSTPANCGACDGTITITPLTGTGPYTYVWTIGGVAPPLPFAGNGTASVTNVCAGLYDVLVTDAIGCDSIFTIPMNNSSGPTGETVTTVDATCNTFCNGSGSIVPIGGVAPYTFLWNDTPSTANDSASNLCAGNYFVQVTDASGCIHFSPVTINEPAPILSNAVITSALCSNICTGAITVAPTGGTAGYSYFWAPGVIVGQGTATVTGLCSGTYTLTITDANLCTQIDSFVVSQSVPLAATITGGNIPCSSACNGVAFVNITSGTAPYTIQWNDAAGQTNDTASALCAGNYSVDITDALGCMITLNTTITSTPALIANATITGASCGMCDGTVTLAPSGGTAGYTYLWSNGQVTATATALCSGLYTVDITDAAGCITSLPVPISNTSGPTSAVINSTNVTCNGSCNGTVTAVTPVGGTAPYSFLWIAGGETTATLSGLCSGVYFVQITDANGCSLIDSVVITEPSGILANQLISAATCGACDGTITIAPSGGTAPYAVLWNTGSSSLALINLCAGVYSVAITDAAGCVQNITIPLNSQSGPTLTMTATNVSCNSSCNGVGTVLATGGVSPFVYLWNDIALQTTPSTTATLCAGTYFVQVTDFAGCVSVASIAITEPDSMGFSAANAVDPLCNGNTNGSITVIPSGGTLAYSYAWTPAPALGQTTSTVINLNANVYTVTVTDGNGCIATQSITLIDPAALTISSTSVNSSCNTIPDGSIDVTVGGGVIPYSYQWSGASVATTEDLTGVLSGTYTITVTDTNSCVILDTIILLPNQTVIADAGNDTSFCQSTSLTLDASASVNGVTYQWFDMTGTLLGSSVTLTFNPAAGVTSYYVIVDNGTGCADSDTVVVTANLLPGANAGVDVTIIQGGNTILGGTPTSGAVGATFLWTPIPGALDNPASANPLATPTATVTYTVTVTSAQGCISSDSIVVTVRPGIIFPDGISPNGDGANDEWIIDGIELFPDCQVEVYNRWGELLFQSVGYKENWKGTYKGKPLPVGTYYYIVDLKDPLFPDAYTGPITIMR